MRSRYHSFSVLFRSLVAALVVVTLCSVSVQAASVVAYWPFDETSGTAVSDQGANGIGGTVEGGASFVPGIRGNALQLNGSGQYADLTCPGGAPSAVANLSQGTISMWFKMDRATGPNEILPLFYLGDASGGKTQSCMIVEIGHFDPGNSKAYFTLISDGQLPLQCYDSRSELQLDKWYHLAVTVGPDGNTGYLNGQEIADRHYNFADPNSALFLSTVDRPQALWIGKGYLWTYAQPQYFSGAIDEVTIYDAPLSGQQISEYYDSMIDPPPPPAIPEPLTATLFATGIGGLAVKMRARTRG